MIKNHIKKLLSCMVVLTMVISTLLYSGIDVDAVTESKSFMIQILNNVASEQEQVKTVQIGETDDSAVQSQLINDIATFDALTVKGNSKITLLDESNNEVANFNYTITGDKQYCVYDLKTKQIDNSTEKLHPIMSFSKNEKTVSYGDLVDNPLTTNVNVKYEISDTDVATIDNGKVVTVKPGTATIKAIVDDDDFEPKEISYDLTVEKRDAQMSFAESMNIQNNVKTVERVSRNYNNEVKFDGKVNNREPNVSYTSSDVKVATVNGSRVTLKKIGQVTITATIENDTYYKDASISYQLNVVKKASKNYFRNITTTGVDETITNENKEIALVSINQQGTFNNLSISYSLDKVTWSEDSPTENQMGKYTIYIRLSDDDYIDERVVTSIIREPQKIVLSKDKDVTLNEDGTFEAEYQDSSILHNTVTYKSDDTGVVKVDGNGKVTTTGFGTTDVTLSVDKVDNDETNEYYAAASATYHITVSELKPEDAQNSFKVISNGEENAYFNDNTYYGKNSVTIVCNEGYEITEDPFGNANWQSSITYNNDKENVKVRVRKSKTKTSMLYSIADFLGFTGEKYQYNFVIDNDAPKIDGRSINIVKKDENKILRFFTFGLFGNSSLTIKVPAKDDKSGYAKAVLYEKNGEDFRKLETCDVKDNETTFDLSADKKYSALYLELIDHVGNVSDKILINHTNTKLDNWNGVFNLEQNAPNIENIQLSEAKYTDNDKKWYNNQNKDGLPTLTFNASDVDSNLYGIKVTVNGTVLKGTSSYQDKNIKTDGSIENGESTSEYLFDYRNVENPSDNKFTINMNDYQNMISYSKENNQGIYVDPTTGEYNVVITVIDKAGNEKKEQLKFYEDITSPEITAIKFTNKAGSSKPDALDVESLMQGNEVYGYFFNEDTTVTVSANDFADKKASAGLNKIYYKLVNKGEVFNKDDLTSYSSKEVNSNGEIEFTVSKGFKGQIYAYVDDHVGLKSKVNHPDGSAIENGNDQESQHKNHANSKINYVTQKVNNDVKGQPLFNGDVTLKLTMQDTFSGLHSVAYTINGVKYEETIDLDKQVVNGWTVEKTDSNLVTEISKEITLSASDFNMNDISVELNGYDNVGNVITAQKEVFSIDITSPVIDVTYDNNEDDPTFENFFKADRTETIVVKERNFDPNGFVAVRTINGKKETLSLNWTTSNVINNVYTDETLHIATVVYNSDADYEFDIVKCEDLAKNNALPFVTHKFTIDKTKPTVQVSYSNNSSRNGNYYNASRTATITITEHNFETSRINVIGTATDNGTTINFPAVNGWSTNGDNHTATINYGYDGDFTFDIEYTDKAGNKMDDYQQEEFIVDMTAPTLDITGVEDHSANAGDIQPVVSYSDTNFDVNGVSISYVGSNKGVVEADGEKSSQANGEVYTFKNPEKKKENDDIYTIHASVVDKAGNETTKEITYSVNRFGSTYQLVDDIKEYNGKYKNKEYNVVVNEINPDTLQNMSVKVSKNNATAQLNPETQFTVNKVNVNGSWNQYQYVINKNLFEKDGKYSVLLYSQDSAGNVNENIDEVKKANIDFGVDKTKPKVVSINLEDGTTYAENKMNGQISVNDNLVLDQVTIKLNGKTEKHTNKDDLYNFAISEKNSAQNATIIAKDAAGNTTTLDINDFFVTTNLFVRWYNNKPLFIGSIVAVLVIAGGAWYFLFAKKKSSNDE